MYNLLKWFGTLLFISVPPLFICSVWFGDVRYAWIGLISGFFSFLSAGYADSVKNSSYTEL